MRGERASLQVDELGEVMLEEGSFLFFSFFFFFLKKLLVILFIYISNVIPFP